MNGSRSKRQRARKAKKSELEQRKLKAYRRRQGLAPGQEEAELASYFRRFVAFLIDQVIYIFFFFFYATLLVAIAGVDFANRYSAVTSALLFGLIYFIPALKRHGQTYGCRKTKIVVIDKSGDKYLDFSGSATRWFVSLGLPTLAASLSVALLPDTYNILVSTFLYIALFAIIYLPIVRTPDRQGVHDMISRAIVIKELKFDSNNGK